MERRSIGEDEKGKADETSARPTKHPNPVEHGWPGQGGEEKRVYRLAIAAVEERIG